MFGIFNRNREEARRKLLLDVLAAQIAPSVRRRREGTTNVESLMSQLQAGDQGDSALHAATRNADRMLGRWAQMSTEDIQALGKGPRS